MTALRNHATTPGEFRQLVKKLGGLLAQQATSHLPTRSIQITTGTGNRTWTHILDERTAIVPILRAGLGLVDPMLELLPDAHIWHIGMGRDETTLEPKLYSNSIPSQLPFTSDQGTCYVLDVMLATGGTLCAVIDLLKSRGLSRIVYVGILAAPEGVRRLQAAHPDVNIHLMAVDDCLNDRGFILPGLGDAGDRQFPKN